MAWCVRVLENGFTVKGLGLGMEGELNRLSLSNRGCIVEGKSFWPVH